jgi:hypothetical protein
VSSVALEPTQATIVQRPCISPTDSPIIRSCSWSESVDASPVVPQITGPS